MRKYKPIQKIIDRYVFVERHKSVKEQLKFFHDLHLAEHERKQLNYLRFIYWGYAYCLYYDKLSIKYEITQFKAYLAELTKQWECDGIVAKDMIYDLNGNAKFVINGDIITGRNYIQLINKYKEEPKLKTKTNKSEMW